MSAGKTKRIHYRVYNVLPNLSEQKTICCGITYNPNNLQVTDVLDDVTCKSCQARFLKYGNSAIEPQWKERFLRNKNKL